MVFLPFLPPFILHLFPSQPNRGLVFFLFALMLSVVLPALSLPPSLFESFPGSSGWISISKPAVDGGRRADSHMAG